MQDEIVAQLGTFGTFFSKPIILFCIFIVSWYLMYVAFNYVKKGNVEKGLKIIFPTLLGSLCLVYIWVSINDLTTLLYNKKIDTLKSEISSIKQEALNKELRVALEKADSTCNDFGFAISKNGKCEPITSDISSFVGELDIKKGIAQDFSKNVRDMIWKTHREQRINLKKLAIKSFKDQDIAYYNANKDELDQVAEDIAYFSFNCLGEYLKILKITRKDVYTYILLDTKNSELAPEQLAKFKNDTSKHLKDDQVILLFNDEETKLSVEDKEVPKEQKSLTSSLKDYQDEMLKSRNNYSYRGEK